MEKRILIAGFGGQGVLFFGKYLAHIGMEKDLHVSWLPSYGPEMRGGTAQCGVVLSDAPIGSPLVVEPDILAALNLPSFLAFESKVKAGGTMIYDSTLISQAPSREDITVRGIPATRLAEDNGLKGLAGMILAGAVLSALPDIDQNVIAAAMRDNIPERKMDMFDANMKAIEMGMA
ncbi:MAG: 2-oxoacid:acceptor oxidoreductase family protein [Oscillospiraceae bacterium]|nr:2-oxoacid:acceptor oxidoreductase family protein [Oscillospiraceae bacterium]